jgi:hypothetical protein
MTAVASERPMRGPHGRHVGCRHLPNFGIQGVSKAATADFEERAFANSTVYSLLKKLQIAVTLPNCFYIAASVQSLRQKFLNVFKTGHVNIGLFIYFLQGGAHRFGTWASGGARFMCRLRVPIGVCPAVPELFD